MNTVHEKILSLIFYWCSLLAIAAHLLCCIHFFMFFLLSSFVPFLHVKGLTGKPHVVVRKPLKNTISNQMRLAATVLKFKTISAS